MTLPPTYTKTPPPTNPADACADLAAILEEKLKNNAPAMARLEQERARVVVRDIIDLQPFGPDGDPNEVIADRFLCKGGIALLAGPTGIGKSTFVIQILFSIAVGRPAFQIRPRKPIRSLYIQAENDDGDVAEIRDGVFLGLEFTEQERAQAGRMVRVVRETAATGQAFVALLARILRDAIEEGRPYDLVVIDPLLSYLGGSVNDQAVVGGFLRNMLTPVLIACNVACLLNHHTIKPPSGKEKSSWSAGDFAYAGAGSSDIANCCRGVLVIRSLGDHEIYQLIAGKRGKRLGWTRDADGHGDPITSEAGATKLMEEEGLAIPGASVTQDDEEGPVRVFDQYIAHSKHRKAIYWRTPSPDEVAQVTGQGEAADKLFTDMTKPFESKDQGLDQAEYVAKAKAQGTERHTARKRWMRGIELGLWKRRGAGKWHMTKKGKDSWAEPADYDQDGHVTDTHRKSNGFAT